MDKRCRMGDNMKLTMLELNIMMDSLCVSGKINDSQGLLGFQYSVETRVQLWKILQERINKIELDISVV